MMRKVIILMVAFDNGYKTGAVRDWLFNQTKE